MALPNITLAQFNAISNGEYNAGQIDFATGKEEILSAMKEDATSTAADTDTSIMNGFTDTV